MRPVAISESPPKRSDIVIVPFPCADQFAEKRRPALLVSSDGFNRKHGLLWVAMITSAGKRGRDGDVEISDLAKAGLPAPSLIRAAKIATIEPSRVLRIAGTLDAKTAGLVRNALLRVLS